MNKIDITNNQIKKHTAINQKKSKHVENNYSIN